MKTKTQSSPSTSASAKQRPIADTVRRVVTPGGEELVLLSRAEYDSLVSRVAEFDEDAADVAIYDARKAESSPLLPAEVSMAMLRGESRLKALRESKDVTQVDLALNAGISQGFLSDLENGKRNMTTDVRRRIAKVLQVPESWLA